MKKIILSALFTLAILVVNGQAIKSGTSEMVNITKGTLHIVLTGDEKFDVALENAVKIYWKHSTYKVIGRADLNKFMNNENNYFIALIVFDSEARAKLCDYNKKANPKEPTVVHTQELVIFNGNKSKLDKYTTEMMMASIPLILENKKEYYNQVDYMIKSLNDGVEVVLKNSFEGKMVAVMNATFKEIRKEASILKNKTLLIDKEEVINDEIMSKYKYKYKVLSCEEISKLMAEGNKEYCVLYMGINPIKQIFIQDLETKKMVYGFSTLSSVDLKTGDFVKLNETIDGKEKGK